MKFVSARKFSLFSVIPFLICSCQKGFKANDYGAFLGREKDISGFTNYKYVSYNLLGFPKDLIEKVHKNGTYSLAYLNIGSLEKWSDDYDEYKDLTFLDYENWPDERWVDVTQEKWQTRVDSFAKQIKKKKAFGVYLDNVDVYTIAKENDLDYRAFGASLNTMITKIAKLGLKVMMNGGSEFLDDMNDAKSDIFDSIWGYHQEEVYSLILDYENDKFGKQDKEDQKYYKSIAQMMKKKGKEVFLLEYTTDSNLKKEIKKFCEEHKYHFYISNNVNLE